MILYIASAYYSFSAMINCQWTLVTSKDRLPIAPILPVRKGDQESQKRMFKYKQSDLRDNWGRERRQGFIQLQIWLWMKSLEAAG